MHPLVLHPQLAYLPAPDVGDDKCVRNTGEMICRGKLKYYEKPAPVPLYLPQMPHKFNRN
jgi:hypothetical protein